MNDNAFPGINDLKTNPSELCSSAIFFSKVWDNNFLEHTVISFIIFSHPTYDSSFKILLMVIFQ